jgi:pseudouridine synthase
MHPSYEIPKVYRARVTGNLTKSVIQKLQNGTIFLDGKPVAPAKAKVIQNGPDQGYLELTLTEGRRHQVKDMCLAVGCPVLLLKRVAYAGIPLDADLAVGETRELREREISSLKKIAGIFKNPHKKAKSTSKG